MASKPTYNQLTQQVKRLEKRVVKLKGVEEQLSEKNSALKVETKELRELNRALRALLTQRDKAMRDFEERVFSNVKKLVLPYINKLRKNDLGMQQRSYLRILRSNLNDIISPFVRQLSWKYSALTPTEIQVAQLIREGKTARQIGAILSSSTRTIESNRQSIRNKLGIKDTKTNLRSYLLST
jgi:DNA-binding CsgD family transcriptional regulator/regulator of replication initiation timing